MRQVGQTTDGREVYADLYSLTHTNGIPLSIVVSEVLARNGMVDWERLLNEMLEHGVKRVSALAQIRDAMPLDWPVNELMEKLTYENA